MDNLKSTGVSGSDDIFGSVPPNLMFDLTRKRNDEFSSEEEKERYYYKLDHEHDKDNSC